MQKVFWIIIFLIVAFGGIIFFIQRNAEPAPVRNLSEEAETPVTPSAPPASPSEIETTRDPMMTGIWKSSTDAKFTREFRDDGIVTDRYENSAEASMSGTWNVVDLAVEAIGNVSADSLTGRTVIKLVWDNDTKTYIAVNSLSETSMTTTDLSGTGVITTFVKL